MSKFSKNHGLHQIRYSYPVSPFQILYSTILPILVTFFVLYLLERFSDIPFSSDVSLSLSTFGEAVGATFLRLLVAYILAVFFAVILAFCINVNKTAETILFPVFDIIQSIPVLAFFPIVVAFFIKFNFFNGAAIFIIFLSMLWNIVFSLTGGLKVIPEDILSVAKVFNVSKWTYYTEVLLPAIVPYLVTGSILAWAQGWNIIIVAEILHTYIPNGTSANDLFGIGSMMVNATASGQNTVFAIAILFMVIVIALLNFFVWQKLLHYAERYKFD